MTAKIEEVNQYVPRFTDFSSIVSSAFFARKLLKRLGFTSNILTDEGQPKKNTYVLSSYKDIRDSTLLIHHTSFLENDEWQRRKGKKILLYHNVAPPQLYSYSKVAYRLCVEGQRQVAATADIFDACVGMSDLNGEDLRQMGHKNIHTVPLLIDSKLMLGGEWDEAYRRNLAYTTNLAFAGRMIAYKGQFNLLKAFIRRLKTHPAAHKLRLHLPGWMNDISYHKKIKQTAAALGIKKLVKIGVAEHSQLLALFRSADVYVSLSEHEGFGMPLIEAALYGVPVVGKGVYAVPETMGEGGLVTKTTAPEQVADIIDLVLNQPQVRRKMLAAQKKNLGRFREEKVLRSLEKVLNSIGVKAPKPAAGTAVQQAPRPTINFFGNGLKPLTDCMVKGGYIKHSYKWGPEPPDVTLNVGDHIKAPLRGTVRALYNGANDADQADKILLDTQFDLVAQPTDAAADCLRADGVRAPIIAVGFGVRRLKTANNKRLLHVTSNPRRSGLDILLKAYERLPKTFNLMVQTADHCRERVEQLAKKCRRRVEIITSPTNPPPTQILVMPSRHNGFELAIADAMHSNMSVVGNDLGELCTDDTAWLADYALKQGTDGELVAETDPKRLAEVILAAQAAEKLEAAKRMVDSKAEKWQIVAERIKTAIKSLERMPLLRPEPNLAWLICGRIPYAETLRKHCPPCRRNQKLFKPTGNLSGQLKKHKIKTVLLHYDPEQLTEKQFLSLLKSLKGTKIHLFLHGDAAATPKVSRTYRIGTGNHNPDDVYLPAKPDNPSLVAAKVLNIIDGDAMNRVFAAKSSWINCV